MWWIHTMEYYSTVKKNEMKFPSKWMTLIKIILSKVIPKPSNS